MSWKKDGPICVLVEPDRTSLGLSAFGNDRSQLLHLCFCLNTLKYFYHDYLSYEVFNRPGVAGAVLHTALSLFD